MTSDSGSTPDWRSTACATSSGRPALTFVVRTRTNGGVRSLTQAFSRYLPFCERFVNESARESTAT